jgi:flavin-dependent thymidylate synthase
MRPTINDLHLSVSLCKYASSPDPIAAIWMHQHVCVAESIKWTADKLPSRKGRVNAIITEMQRGHWDILTAAHAQVHFEGYPHDTAMQWRTHQSMGTLTQSLRYTGDRFLTSDLDAQSVRSLFYVEENEPDVDYADTIIAYRSAIKAGAKPEQARRRLAAGYRQGWSCAGNLKDWLHLLDRRLLGDTQLEARHAAWAAVDELRSWCPEIVDWYVENRAGKNKLAP